MSLQDHIFALFNTQDNVRFINVSHRLHDDVGVPSCVYKEIKKKKKKSESILFVFMNIFLIC